ncbi:MAG TPA: zf-HC2 domain-containing protein, partial [Rugosimonospora sp.]|nr:zf-HC2 domain-containing protein [Rugosimonospora sp.]
MRCPEAIEAGAYVLGALSPAERSTYQRHMATCGQCRDEVADLAGLPGLLGRLDEATAVGLSGGVAAPTPAPAVLTGVLDKVRVER